MDNEELACAEQLVADDQRTDCIIAGTSTGVTDDVGISFYQTGEFGWIKTGIHIGEHREAASGWQARLALPPNDALYC
jgi:hypothetical protein